MANLPYDQARYWFVTGGLDWLTTDLQLVAWSGSPYFSSNDQTIADLIAHGVPAPLGFSLPITSKTVTSNGTTQTNQVVIPGVPVGPEVTWFTMCRRNAAVPNLSELILFLDDVDGLPFEPNGLDMVVQPDWALNRGWFRA